MIDFAYLYNFLIFSEFLIVFLFFHSARLYYILKEFCLLEENIKSMILS